MKKKIRFTLAIVASILLPISALAVYIPFQGGTGTSLIPISGQVLVGQANGTYAPQATSTLGISGGVSSVFGRSGVITALSGDYTTSIVTEGSNLYWTNNRFDTRLSATTSLPNITSLTGVSSIGTINVGVWNGTAIADGYVASASAWNAKVSSQWLTSGSNISYSTGNVGIGTTTPSARLSVASSGASIGFTVQSTQGVAAGAVAIGSLNPGGRIQAFANDSTATAAVANLILNDSGGNVGVGSTSPYARLSVKGNGLTTGVNFQTTNSSNAPSFTILDSGNVGIGIATPLEKLDVAGAIRVTGILTAGAVAANAGFFESQGSGLNRIDTFGPNTSTRGSFSIYQAFSNNGSGQTPFYIDPTGNVGVGSTSPYARLSVKGAGTTGVNFQTTNSSDAPLFTILDSGNVGIGTAAPVALLNISGSKSAASWSTTGLNFAVDANTLTDTSGSGTIAVRAANSFGIPTLAASNTETITNAATLYISGAPTAGANTTITNTFGLYQAAGNAFISGNVGIGIIAAAAKLDVSGAIRTSIGSGGTITAFESDGTRQNRAILGADASGAYLDTTFSSGGTADLLFKTVGSTKMILKQGGNVGIGTTTPNSKLNIYGGGIQLDPGVASRPTCSVATRGQIWNTFGGAGVADTFAVCQKDAADAYSWVIK